MCGGFGEDVVAMVFLVFFSRGGKEREREHALHCCYHYQIKTAKQKTTAILNAQLSILSIHPSIHQPINHNSTPLQPGFLLLPPHQRKRPHGSENPRLQPRVLGQQDRDPACVGDGRFDRPDDLVPLDVELARWVERDVVPGVVVPFG